MTNSLYPNDTFTGSTGEHAVGLGADGKYTNGTVSPHIPPSRVPASQFNLTNDLLGNMIAGARLTPNNSDTNQLVDTLHYTSRFLEWSPTKAYQYGDIVSARLFEGVGITRLYKCSSNHTGVDPRTSSFSHWYNLGEQAGTLLFLPYVPTPSIDGYIQLNGASIADVPEYTRLHQFTGNTLPDMRGRVARGIGGEASGLLQPQDDAMQRITATIASVMELVSNGGATGAGYGAIQRTGLGNTSSSWDHSYTAVGQYSFDSAIQTKFANETRVKSMGWVACIVF